MSTRIFISILYIIALAIPSYANAAQCKLSKKQINYCKTQDPRLGKTQCRVFWCDSQDTPPVVEPGSDCKLTKEQIKFCKAQTPRLAIAQCQAHWCDNPDTPPFNAPPVVDAGNDLVVSPVDLVTLSGSATDPEGGTMILEWTQTKGSKVVLSNKDDAITTFTAPAAEGLLGFRLTAKDNYGATGSDAVSVSVKKMDSDTSSEFCDFPGKEDYRSCPTGLGAGQWRLCEDGVWSTWGPECPEPGIAWDDLPCAKVIDGQVCEIALPTSNGSYQNPAWSPESRAILFTFFPGGYNSGSPVLRVIDLDTGEVRDVGRGVNLPGNTNTWNLSDKIVYAHEPNGDYNVLKDAKGKFVIKGEQGYVSSITGNLTPSPITNNPEHAWEPALSPEGRYTEGNWVVFQDRNDAEILITEVHANFQVRRDQPHYVISPPSATVKQPVWSADGRSIIYQRRQGSWQLKLIEVPKNPAAIAANPEAFTRDFNLPGTDPSFSPDGTWVVFSGGKSTAHDTVYLAKVANALSDGKVSTVKVTKNTSDYEGAPAWSNDGRFIAFESSPGDPNRVGRTTLRIAKMPN